MDRNMFYKCMIIAYLALVAVSLSMVLYFLNESSNYSGQARQNITEAQSNLQDASESLKPGTYPWDDTWRAFEGDKPNPYALETSKEVSAEIFDLMQRYGEGEFSDVEYGTLLLDAGRRHAAARWREKEYGVK